MFSQSFVSEIYWCHLLQVSEVPTHQLRCNEGNISDRCCQCQLLYTSDLRITIVALETLSSCLRSQPGKSKAATCSVIPAQGSKVSWPTKPHNVCSNNFRIRHVMMFTHNSQLGSPESRGCEPTGGNWWTLAASWNGRWSQWMSMTLSSSSNLCHWHSLPLQCQWLD